MCRILNSLFMGFCLSNLIEEILLLRQVRIDPSRHMPSVGARMQLAPRLSGYVEQSMSNVGIGNRIHVVNLRCVEICANASSVKERRCS